nr:hypothetical protein CFP56_60968 [Quercus suber]
MIEEEQGTRKTTINVNLFLFVKRKVFGNGFSSNFEEEETYFWLCEWLHSLNSKFPMYQSWACYAKFGFTGF